MHDILYGYTYIPQKTKYLDLYTSVGEEISNKGSYVSLECVNTELLLIKTLMTPEHSVSHLALDLANTWVYIVNLKLHKQAMALLFAGLIMNYFRL